MQVRKFNFIIFFLLIILARLVFLLIHSWPSLSMREALAKLEISNIELSKENSALAKKILQVHNNGHILQQHLRYYKNYFSEHETFYKVKNWENS